LVRGPVEAIERPVLTLRPDIVKVRLQTTTQYSSAVDCASKILKNEGPLAFYKGTLTPLIGIGACVS
jgi:solute carrier family 25 carnitine/acylcarnitine transporter 20/29